MHTFVDENDILLVDQKSSKYLGTSDHLLIDRIIIKDCDKSLFLEEVWASEKKNSEHRLHVKNWEGSFKVIAYSPCCLFYCCNTVSDKLAEN